MNAEEEGKLSVAIKQLRTGRDRTKELTSDGDYAMAAGAAETTMENAVSQLEDLAESSD